MSDIDQVPGGTRDPELDPELNEIDPLIGEVDDPDEVRDREDANIEDKDVHEPIEES